MAFDYTQVDLDAILARAYSQMSEFQRGGVGKGRSKGRVLFNVWMGIGKTFMGLTLGFCYKPQTWLIIGSKNTLNTWRAEVKKWFPEFGDDDIFKIVRGTATERQRLWKQPALFYATTAASFIRDVEWLATKKIRFDVISGDEFHKWGLRNHKSQGFKAVKLVIKLIERHFTVKCVNLMTGTWTSKGPPQQWPALNILAPREFRSYWEHVRTYCNVIKGAFGTEIIGPKNTEGLAIVTSPYVYTVTEEMAKSELPPIQRMRLEAELPKALALHYDTLLNELYMDHDDTITSVSTILASYTKLRQLITCPSTISPSLGVGPAIEIVADKILDNDEVSNWRHNLVFTPFLASIPIFRSYLADQLTMPEQKILILKGGIEPEELQAVEEEFRRDKNTMILSSLKFGQSWNAETALNCYFPHFDWDQDENKQCEGRSRRKNGTQEHIGCYYVNIAGTITEDMLEVLNRKTHNNNITYQDFERIRQKTRARLGLTQHEG